MKGKHLVVSTMVLVAWLMLAPFMTMEYLAAGVLVSAGVGIAFGRSAFAEAGWSFLSPRRWFYFLVYVLVLLRGIVLAGLLVASMILKRNIQITPGVVAIPTHLKKRWEITLLANSITLTPGTFFLDMNEEEKVLYVHWISMQAEGVADMRRIITESYEKILSKVFE